MHAKRAFEIGEPSRRPGYWSTSTRIWIEAKRQTSLSYALNTSKNPIPRAWATKNYWCASTVCKSVHILVEPKMLAPAAKEIGPSFFLGLNLRNGAWSVIKKENAGTSEFSLATARPHELGTQRLLRWHNLQYTASLAYLLHLAVIRKQEEVFIRVSR